MEYRMIVKNGFYLKNCDTLDKAQNLFFDLKHKILEESEAQFAKILVESSFARHDYNLANNLPVYNTFEYTMEECYSSLYNAYKNGTSCQYDFSAHIYFKRYDGIATPRVYGILYTFSNFIENRFFNSGFVIPFSLEEHQNTTNYKEYVVWNSILGDGGVEGKLFELELIPKMPLKINQQIIKNIETDSNFFDHRVKLLSVNLMVKKIKEEQFSHLTGGNLTKALSEYMETALKNESCLEEFHEFSKHIVSQTTTIAEINKLKHKDHINEQ